MGLATKIKNALHGDDEKTYEGDHPPGTYPDETTGKHGDRYSSTTNSKLDPKYDDPRHAETTGATGSGSTGTGSGAIGTNAVSGSGHNRRYEDLPQGGEKTTRHGHQDSGIDVGPTQHSTKQHSGLAGHDSAAGRPDEPYWGDVQSGERHGHHGHGAGATGAGAGALASQQGPTDRHRGNEYGTHSSAPRGDQAVGGGVYNTVTGAGSHEGGGGDRRQFPLSSTEPHHHAGGAGMPRSAGSGITNQSLHGSRDDRDGGAGMAVAGAGAGAGAGLASAGLAHRQRGEQHGASGYERYDEAGVQQGRGAPRGNDYGGEPGLPQSSMLDPYGTANTGVSKGGMGGRDVRQDYGDSAAGGSVGSGPMGKDHFGPGHEGAKVFHKCQRCGEDNDISQYFKKDTVYRIGD